MNLLSINKALKNKYKQSKEDLLICLSKVSAPVTFDRVIKTRNDSVSVICL